MFLKLFLRGAWYMGWVALWLLLAFLATQFDTSKAHAHSDAIINCTNNIRYEKAVKVMELIYSDNGLLSEFYDTNGDGRWDIETQSHTVQPSDQYEGEDDYLVEHQPNPVFWFVDLDFNGTVDFVFVDKGREGKCNDIVLYENFHKPRHNDDGKPSYKRGGKAGI